MVEKIITIINPSGLHARPANRVVEFVKDYKGEVEVVHNGKVGNLKSILMLLSMGLAKDTCVTLRVDGPNEQAFIEELALFIQSLDG